MSYVSVDAGVTVSAAAVGLPSTYVTYASGCAGSRRAARLVPMDTPRIGDDLDVRLLDLPADAAIVAFGWSNGAWGSLPLPAELSPIGMPGCWLRTSVDASMLVVGSNGSAVFRLSVPNVPWLIGARFHCQALVPDPAAGNPAGAVVSDAAEAVVGW